MVIHAGSQKATSNEHQKLLETNVECQKVMLLIQTNRNWLTKQGTHYCWLIEVDGI